MPLLLPRTGLDFSKSRSCHHHLDMGIILDTCTKSCRKLNVVIMSYLKYYTVRTCKSWRRFNWLQRFCYFWFIELNFYFNKNLQTIDKIILTFSIFALCKIAFTHVNFQDPLLFLNHASGKSAAKRKQMSENCSKCFSSFPNKIHFIKAPRMNTQPTHKSHKHIFDLWIDTSQVNYSVTFFLNCPQNVCWAAPWFRLILA